MNEAEKRYIAQLKHKVRQAKLRYMKINKLKALPRLVTIKVNTNYVNPVTLNKVPYGPTVYEVRNSKTGRIDYYDKLTFWKLMPRVVKNNYNLLLLNPKEPIPGVRNPMTRGAVFPRNVRRVIAKPKTKTPSPNTAAKKIQSAVRKMISKKRAAAKSKTPSPNKRKTPSPNKRKTPSKSKSRSK